MALASNNMEDFTKIVVSGLPCTVTEAQIVLEFKKFGAIQYVRLKKSRSSSSCLINFLQKDSAHKARSSLNCQFLFNKRVQVCFPDCFPIKDPSKNLFIKKIPFSCDLSLLESLFSPFGPILNSKIVFDQKGNPLGYGFLMFDSKDTVTKILNHKTEFTIFNESLEIEPFVPKNFRPLQRCNVYVKGFPQSYTREQLLKKFSEFGKVLSPIICSNAGQVFGFVSFEDPDSVDLAIDALDGKESENFLWVVKRSLNRPERRIDQKQKKKEIQEKWQKQNLYIKNWPVELGEEQLRSVFERFGKVESVKFVTQECLNMYFSYPITEVKPTGQVFICFADEKAADLVLYSMRHVLVNGVALSIHRWVPKTSLLKVPKKVQKPERCEKPRKVEPVQYFNMERYKNAGEENKKRVFGEAIYQEIFCKYENLTGKITGMIIELDESELLNMMQNKFLLYGKAKEALKILSGAV